MMSAAIARYRWLALVSYFALFICVVTWQFGTDYSEQSALFRGLFYVLPLLFPMYGIAKENPIPTHGPTLF